MLPYTATDLLRVMRADLTPDPTRQPRERQRDGMTPPAACSSASPPHRGGRRRGTAGALMSVLASIVPRPVSSQPRPA